MVGSTIDTQQNLRMSSRRKEPEFQWLKLIRELASLDTEGVKPIGWLPCTIHQPPSVTDGAISSMPLLTNFAASVSRSARPPAGRMD
ncbi:unnamed protein product [Protopolystoma xenopodis]|uniref:Uncharacterized protein n=1 Tax=Protopolystoma xenopodis TaxID=117903 RepID=A0A3S5BQV8_9PLAT|nr:unnamed protein product [Protopolystoma xenopodis]